MTELDKLRTRIDTLDAEIIDRLVERFEICRTIGGIKRDDHIPMMQVDRVRLVKDRYRGAEAPDGLPDGFGLSFANSLLDATCALEDDIIGIEAEAR